MNHRRFDFQSLPLVNTVPPNATAMEGGSILDQTSTRRWDACILSSVVWSTKSRHLTQPPIFKMVSPWGLVARRSLNGNTSSSQEIKLFLLFGVTDLP